MGMGTNSCSKFAEVYRESPARWEILFFSWAQGFMSGLNFERIELGQYRDMSAMPTGAQKNVIRVYCDRHPLGNYMDAVIDLYQRLPLMNVSH